MLMRLPKDERHGAGDVTTAPDDAKATPTPAFRRENGAEAVARKRRRSRKPRKRWREEEEERTPIRRGP